jgi:pyrrolidone-carboxylate peptidase
MKLLVYAFEPFGQNAENISQQVLKRLRVRKNVMKMSLPVKFNSSIIIDAVEDAKPNIILGLGQYPRGKKFRIERLAKNRRKSKGHLQTSITENGAAKAVVTLKLQPDVNSRISYNAGRYVCNYSIYVLLTNTITKDIPLAFLHIPKKVDVNKATEMVEHKIDEILVQSLDNKRPTY